MAVIVLSNESLLKVNVAKHWSSAAHGNDMETSFMVILKEQEQSSDMLSDPL